MKRKLLAARFKGKCRICGEPGEMLSFHHHEDICDDCYDSLESDEAERRAESAREIREEQMKRQKEAAE